MVGLVPTPGSQDGAGKSGNYYTSYKLKKDILSLNQKFIEAFEGKEGCVVVPLYFNINSKMDYPYINEQDSYRNETMVMRQTDCVHLSIDGYLKIADVWYSYIVSELR